MPITNSDQLFAGLNNAMTWPFVRLNTGTDSAAGYYRTLALAGTGRPANVGTVSTSGRACDGTTYSDSYAPPAVTGTTRLYAMGASATLSQGGTVMIYDRLADGAFNYTLATQQNFSALASARAVPDAPPATSTNVAGELWLETTAAGTVGPKTFHLSYVNAAGATVNTESLGTPLSMGAILPAGVIAPVRLPNGDLVQSVNWIKLIADGFNFGGNPNLVILRRVVTIDTGANANTTVGVLETGMPVIAASPCLCLAVLNSATSLGTVSGSLRIGQG
jgi:hypothetical protein